MRALHIFIACLVLALLAGCQEKSNRLPVYKASGVLKYRDKPLDRATVSLYCPANGATSYSMTNPNGEFVLSTYETGDGAPEGEYIVTVTKMTENDDDGSYIDENGDIHEKRGGGGGGIRSLIPEKYSNQELSELRFTITPEGPNNVELNLQ